MTKMDSRFRGNVRRLPKLPSFNKTPENSAFLSYQAEIAEKLRSFDYFLCKTKPISEKVK